MESADASLLVWTYVLVLARVGGFVALLPVPGSFGVPAPVRTALAIVLSFVVALSLESDISPSESGLGQVLQIGSELILGLLVGFCFRLVFAAFQLAGQLISIQMGLGFAVLVDPNSSSQLSLISHYLYILAALVFLSIDGHVVIVAIMFDSFHIIPLGEGGVLVGSRLIVEWAGVVFWGALWVALPILIILLLASVGFGVITRATPQLNIFAIGFPVTLLLGMLGLMYMTPTIGLQVEQLFERAVETSENVLGAIRP